MVARWRRLYKGDGTTSHGRETRKSEFLWDGKESPIIKAVGVHILRNSDDGLYPLPDSLYKTCSLSLNHHFLKAVPLP